MRILVLLILIVSSAMGAEPRSGAYVIGDSLKTSVYLNEYAYLFEDSKSNMHFSDAMELMKSEGLKQGVPQNLSFQESTYWYIIPIKHQMQLEADYYLSIEYPLLDDVRVFIIDQASSNIRASYQLGDTYPFHDRLFDHPYFVIPLKFQPDDSAIIIFRIESSSALNVPISIAPATIFSEKFAHQSILQGIVVGVLLIMFVYNLFISIALKEGMYALLAVAFLSFMFFYVSFHGIAFHYLWPTFSKWNGISIPFFVFLTVLFFTLLVERMFSFRSTVSRYHSILIITRYFLMAQLLLVFFIPYKYSISIAISSVFFCTAIGLGFAIYAYKQGVKAARFFLLSFSLITIGVIFWALNITGILVDWHLPSVAAHLTAIVCSAIFSLALTDRINIEKKEKIDAEFKSQQYFERYKELYDSSEEAHFTVNLDGGIKSTNTAFLNIVGAKSTEELLSCSYNLFTDLFVDAGSQEKFKQLIDEPAKSGFLELEAKALSGGKVWLKVPLQSLTKTSDGHIRGSFLDVSHAKQQSNKVKFLNIYDPLTYLLNRQSIMNYLSRALLNMYPDERNHAFVIVNLDYFKNINQHLGTKVGNKVLTDVSKIMVDLFRDYDKIARISADEFAVLLQNCREKDALNILEKLKNNIKNKVRHSESKSRPLTASIGVTMLNGNEKDAETVLKLAVAACDIAKETGRDKVVFYHHCTDLIEKKNTDELVIEKIHHALQNDEFILYKQSIMPLKPSDNSERFEVLIRMKDGDELLSPGLFLPVAEAYDLIPLIDKWVIENVFKFISKTNESNSNISQININLSGKTLSDSSLLNFIVEQASKYQIQRSLVCFEITESSAIAQLSHCIELIQSLRKDGFRFALDDFGSGHTSYSYLRSLPVDSIKIDGAFIRESLTDPFDKALVKSITDISHVIGLTVVAEFVETREAVERLVELNVDYAQGYYFDKPSPLS
ncbi:MAG: EAL domain-containing protein [Gammaproteobacteria bacterium]|nr:EAL domain-containing protein [Gammaproteobacteria bacterium]